MEFVRLTLKMTKKLYDELVKVKNEQGYMTMTETVIKCIKIGLFVHEKSKDGPVLITDNEGNQHELIL